MARPVYKYKVKLKGSEKHDLRQAKKKGRKNARLVIRILIILLADAGKAIAETAVTCNSRGLFLMNKRAGNLARLAIS